MSTEARKKRSAEKREEMERRGAPYGRYADGTPRTRPEVPENRRSYYVVYGIKRASGERIAFKGFKSRRRAGSWIADSRVLLKQSCEKIEIVRSKLVEEIALD